MFLRHREMFLQNGDTLFQRIIAEKKAEPAINVKTLHAKIGELTLENDFLEKALTKAGLLGAKA